MAAKPKNFSVTGVHDDANVKVNKADALATAEKLSLQNPGNVYTVTPKSSPQNSIRMRTVSILGGAALVTMAVKGGKDSIQKFHAA